MIYRDKIHEFGNGKYVIRDLKGLLQLFPLIEMGAPRALKSLKSPEDPTILGEMIVGIDITSTETSPLIRSVGAR